MWRGAWRDSFGISIKYIETKNEVDQTTSHAKSASDEFNNQKLNFGANMWMPT